MNKAELIRSCLDERYLQTNQEIQELVLRKYGVSVGQNEIINTLGSFAERSKTRVYDPRVLGIAKRLLEAAGSPRNARRVITFLDCQR